MSFQDLFQAENYEVNVIVVFLQYDRIDELDGILHLFVKIEDAILI